MKIYTMRLMIAKHDPQDFISDVAVLVVEILKQRLLILICIYRSKMDIFCRKYP